MFVVDNSNIIQPTKVLMLNTFKKNNPLEFSELFGINVELEGIQLLRLHSANFQLFIQFFTAN